MTTFGSLARVIGPLIVVVTYTSVGTYLSLGIVASSMVITLILNLAVYDRLVPLKINQDVLSSSTSSSLSDVDSRLRKMSRIQPFSSP